MEFQRHTAALIRGARRMGRKKKFAELIMARLPAGMTDRIEALLGETEDRADFVRIALTRELERREADQPEKKKRKG
jgi:hypothetical protein